MNMMPMTESKIIKSRWVLTCDICDEKWDDEVRFEKKDWHASKLIRYRKKVKHDMLKANPQEENEV